MSLLQNLQKKEMTPRTVILSISIFVLAVAGALALFVKLLTGSPAVAVRTPMQPATPASMTNTLPIAPAKAAAMEKLAAEEGDYAVITKRDLFRSSATKIAAVPPAETPQKNVFDAAPTAPAAPSEPTQPQVAFTGAVDIAGQKYALLESLDDHLSQYTRIGGTAFGYTLMGIADRSVTLEANGETLILKMGDNKEEEAFTPATPAAQQNTTRPTGMPNGMTFGPNGPVGADGTPLGNGNGGYGGYGRGGGRGRRGQMSMGGN